MPTCAPRRYDRFVIRIRRALFTDVETAKAIVVMAYQQYVSRIGTKPGPMSADYESLVRGGHVWLATDDDTVVALMVLMPKSDHLLLENIAVDPAAQHRGIGRQLMAFVEDEARRRGLTEVRLYTNEAMVENLAYYGRRGYTETHRATEHGFRRVFFRKALT